MAYSGRTGGSGKKRPGSGGRSSSSRGGSARGDKSFGRKTTGSRGPRDDDRPAFKKKSFDKPIGDRRRRDEGDEKPRFSGSRGSSSSRKPFAPKDSSRGDKPFGDRRRRDDGDEKPRFSGSRGSSSSSSSSRKPFGPKDSSRGDKPFGDRRRRDDGDEKPRFSGNRSSSGSRKPFGRRRDDNDDSRDDRFQKKPFGDKPFGGKPAYRGKRGEGEELRGSRSGSGSRGGSESGGRFTRRPFGGDSKPSWKKGDRDESSFSDRKRSTSAGRRDESGEGEWKVFDKKEDAQEFTRSAGGRKHRGKSDFDSAQSDKDGTIRLNKYIANTGLCSRREADEMIEAGVIKVNGKIVTQLGTKIGPGDVVHYGDQLLRRENLVYVLLNKPKDYITTTDDPQERKTVLDLVSGAGTERIYPVGRLDRNTTGVLLLTNDGDLAERLMHPKYGVEKIYQVSLDMNLRKEDFDKIMEGIELEDGFIKADDMSFVGDGTDHKEVGIVLHSGRNRVVRRMFEHLGYTVKALDRVGYAGLTKKNIPKGKWRFLEAKEVGFLKMKVGGERKRSKS